MNQGAHVYILIFNSPTKLIQLKPIELHNPEIMLHYSHFYIRRGGGIKPYHSKSGHASAIALG